ncbi:MAG: hypothetical protein IJL02_01345 [Methanobrevibacter sp.]|uniref:hypothetical protein n=1 Tax=Methanobrevibacter sp. TaxID=66852 RepID=UPI0025DCF314|nr:hypothetical protein [Methanobrevibacter sp.]MBQ6098492.1 hypothetical protein [Methanobrevibacter sp.]
MGLFSKSPKEKEAKRAKKFQKKLNDAKNKLNSNNQSKMHNIVIRDLVELARTKDEYLECSELFKQWADIFLPYLESGKPRFDWIKFKQNMVFGMQSLLITADFVDVVEYSDKLTSLKDFIYSLVINGNPFIDDKNDLYTVVGVYLGFALFKLGKYDESFKILHPIGLVTVPISSINDELDDYGKEMFGEYRNELFAGEFCAIIAEDAQDGKLSN